MLDTTRRVATPEGIELTLRLAGPVPRALAWSVDLALRLALVLLVMTLAAPLRRAGWGVVLL
ncbi:MAG TPA: RDD family protein, partial [Burkholderiales bacterium]|nr:RDD family protein [Burkholderiales bacterium]